MQGKQAMSNLLLQTKGTTVPSMLSRVERKGEYTQRVSPVPILWFRSA